MRTVAAPELKPFLRLMEQELAGQRLLVVLVPSRYPEEALHGSRSRYAGDMVVRAAEYREAWESWCRLMGWVEAGDPRLLCPDEIERELDRAAQLVPF